MKIVNNSNISITLKDNFPFDTFNKNLGKQNHYHSAVTIASCRKILSWTEHRSPFDNDQHNEGEAKSVKLNLICYMYLCIYVIATRISKAPI